MSAAIRLQATDWTENLGRVSLMVLLGTIFGIALAKSIFSGRITFLMGLVYSVAVVPWQLGLLMPDMEWIDRINLIYARLYWAIADFLQNKPVQDPILFLTTMMLLYWLTSLISSYRLVRHANPWAALLSLGGMILVIEYTMEAYKYTKVSGGTYSFLYLVFCLLLMGRIYFLRSRKEWEQRGGTVEMEVGYDLGRGVAVVAVVVALLAWNTPQMINFFTSDPSQERVSKSWQMVRDRVSKAVNSLRSTSPVTVEGYGSSLSLGTGGVLGDQQVFTVKPDAGRPSGRFYWAARTYDRYLGGDGGWESTMDASRKMGPGAGPMLYPGWEMRKDVSLTFVTTIPLLKTLYFTNEPLSISKAATAIVGLSPDGATDLNAIVMEPPLRAGDAYTVLATVPQPTVLAMRDAGEEYPDWVKERYLQVPDGFSPRVMELARQIGGAEATPYDKAQAITQYLRRTITYTERVPEMPRGREPIEWFLFDLRAGFCNYYASSEVMMLRSLGVPARMVAGYAEGTWNPEQNVYSVIGKDSHAWPEVYFPKLGWVSFEPTVAQPQTSYPQGEVANQEALPSSGNPSSIPTIDPFYAQGELRAEQLLEEEAARQRAAQQARLSPWLIVALVALVALALVAVWEWRRRRQEELPFPSWFEKSLDERGVRTPGWLRLWSRQALRTPMENLFANVAFMLRVWGMKVDPALTPAEQVALLVNVVPDVKDHAITLLEEYQRAMYSQYPANVNRARDAVNDLRSIGYRNWLMRLVGLEA